MMSWGASVTPRREARTTQGEKGSTTEGTTVGKVDARAGTRRNFADTIRRQFRSVMRALTRSEPSPAPAARRRKEETGRSFSAARMIFRRVFRFVPLPALNPEWEPFTWLRLWDYSEPANSESWVLHETEGSDLSPHP
jgi:hypothetical protein